MRLLNKPGRDDECYPCWTIVADQASDSAIVYWRYGHSDHWGLVSLSRLCFGMDSGWFLHLEDAFVESQLASYLPIWNLVRAGGEVAISSVTLDSAFALRNELEGNAKRSTYHVVYRSRHTDRVQ